MKIKKIGGVLGAALAAGTLMASSSFAISHANKFSAPLTPPFEECGSDESTTDCNAVYATLSPWEFDQGTVEIDNTSVGLKLDDIKLRSGYECTDIGGGTSACRCWDANDAQYCNDNSPCTAGGCGPSSEAGSDNNYFKVEIWAQTYHPGGDLCGWPGFLCPHIERDACHKTVYFDLKNVSGNRNEDVDQSVSIAWGDCTSSVEAPEIRQVEVYDKWGNIVGSMAFK